MTRQISPAKLRSVVKGILKVQKGMDGWAQWSGERKLRSHKRANEWFLGVMLDQGIKWETAWNNGLAVASHFGNERDPGRVWQRMAKLTPREARAFCRTGLDGKAVHRFSNRMADNFRAAAKEMIEKYDSDPRRIWRANADVWTVKARLIEFRGIGEQLARMAVMILARDGQLGDQDVMRDLDVKVDVHVRRVMARTGLTRQGATISEITEAARKHAGRSLAEFDSGAWKVGHDWCGKSKPRCGDCPLTKACPKLV